MALPAIAAALGAAAIGGIASLKGGSDQRKHAKAEAAKQREFQRDMSNTAYQRAVDDMKKAGLNPMLAYQQGGASSPVGAKADIEDIVTPAISSAKQSALIDAELKSIRAAANNANSSAENQRAQSYLAAENQNLAQQHFRESEERAKLNKAQTQLLKYQAPAAKNLAEMEATSFGKNMPYIERLLRIIFSGGGAASPLRLNKGK